MLSALLLCIAAGAWIAAQRLVLPTRVTLVNYPGFTAARIIAGADGLWVQADSVPLAALDEARGAALVLVFGRGISLDEEQQAALRGMAQDGTAVVVEAATDANTDVTSLAGAPLDQVRAYLSFGGASNYRNLMNFARQALDKKIFLAPMAAEPEAIPRDVLFARESEAVFPEVAAYENHMRAQGNWPEDARKLVLLTSVPGPFNANRDHIDALIDAFSERGFRIYPVAAAGRRLEFMQTIQPDALLYMPHGALTLDQRDEAIAWLEQQDIPMFTPLSLFTPHAEWLDDPQGFSGSLLTMNLVLAEIDGGVDPFASIALYPDAEGLEVFRTIPDRLPQLVERVERRLALKEMSNADKRVAIFFLKGPGDGAMSAGNLEVAPSLHRLLLTLREAGYDLGDLPDDPAAFESQVLSQAPILAPYARGAMADWLDSGKPAWLETATYREACATQLGADMCARIEAEYGPAPGDYLAAADRSAIAVARLQFGNVAILPQPLPGIGADAFRLIHGADVAPPHPYAAAYLWARESFDADAIMHFGTHGSLEFTPGKQVALSSQDWADALIGDLPHFYIYTINNVGEAIIAKRRSYATILSHLTPPLAAAGLTGDLAMLKRALNGLTDLAAVTSTERLVEVRELAERLDLIRGLKLPAAEPWDKDVLLKLANFVEAQETVRITLGLYTLGGSYEPAQIDATIKQMTAGPLASSLLELDRLLGKPVAAAEASEKQFSAQYRRRADAAVAAMLTGGSVEGSLATVISPELRARANELRVQLARPDDGAIIRNLISMSDATPNDSNEDSAPFARQALVNALLPAMADPAQREIIESWRSAEQLQRAVGTLDPAVRARAEQVARVIAPMREVLEVTARPEMRAVLEQLRSTEAQAELVTLLDDPDLETRLQEEMGRYRTRLAAEAIQSQRVALFLEATAANASFDNMPEARRDAIAKALKFYADTEDLDKILTAANIDSTLTAQLDDAGARAVAGLKRLAADNRRRDTADRAFLDTVDRIISLVQGVPARRDAIAVSGARELQQTLRALNGGFIRPSPGGDPVIAPAALPTGRNMVAIDAERTPSEAAWGVGEQLATDLLESYRSRHGDYPQKVAMTLWPGDFIQSEGAMIAQIFYLLGVEPVRDPFGRVTDVRLVPAESLQFPRVDVVVQTAGQLRDLAASRLYLINKAVSLAAAAGDSNVAASTQAVEEALLANGLSPLDARRLATQRVFGGVNGNYGTGIMGLVESGSAWESGAEIGKQYLVNMNARYGAGEDWGANTPGLLEAALAGTDAVVQPRESNTTGPLSLDHVYEFMGGLSRAVTTVTGSDPDAYFNDFRTPGAAGVTDLEAAIAEELHATLLNPKYIEGLTGGGASSAAVFAETFRNAYGWEAMRPEALGDAAWNELFAVYVEDREQLGLREFFERVHPQSLQEVTAVMLETVRKGLWQASDSQITALAELHGELIERHGAGCSGFVCGNEKLRDYIAAAMPAAQAKAYEAELDRALVDPGAKDNLVLKERNQKSTEQEGGEAAAERRQTDSEQTDTAAGFGSSWLLTGLLAAAVLVLCAAFFATRMRRTERV